MTAERDDRDFNGVNKAVKDIFPCLYFIAYVPFPFSRIDDEKEAIHFTRGKMAKTHIVEICICAMCSCRISSDSLLFVSCHSPFPPQEPHEKNNIGITKKIEKTGMLNVSEQLPLPSPKTSRLSETPVSSRKESTLQRHHLVTAVLKPRQNIDRES